jgi:hypothetical protein
MFSSLCGKNRKRCLPCSLKRGRCTRNFILIRSPGPPNAPLCSYFHTHSIAWPPKRTIVLVFSYSFDRLAPQTHHCTRIFILIRSPGPPDAPLCSYFHTHSIAWPPKRTIVLVFSYSYDRLAPQTHHCTRIFILIRSPGPPDAPLYSKFHTRAYRSSYPPAH